MLQTAYLKVLGRAGALRRRLAFKTWLFALIRNTSAERKRSWLRRLLREREHSPAEAAGLPEAEDALALRGALAKLSQRQREALHLVFYQDLTLGRSRSGHGRIPPGRRAPITRAGRQTCERYCGGIAAKRGVPAMSDEREIRRLFDALRRDDARGRPSLETVLRGAVPGERRAWLLASRPRRRCSR